MASPDRRHRLRRVVGHVYAAGLFPAPVAAKDLGGPLKGVKVVDFTAYQNGPSATVQMADNGADVIKVEPLIGDGLRHLIPAGRFSELVESYNRGKRSITVDLKHPESKELVKKLVQWADVLTENFRPQVMDKLGLGYDVVKAWNPSIIYASNSGFGSVGEWATRPSFDSIAQAFSGVTTVMGGGPSHKPQLVEWGLSDEVGAMNFYQAILAALFAREKNGGKGQQLVTSQTAATLHFQRAQMVGDMKRGKQRDDGQEPNFFASHVQMMQCAGDGKWLMVALQGSRQKYEDFIREVLGRQDILEDERQRNFPSLKKEAKEWFKDEIGKTIATKPRQHWLDLAAKFSIPCGPCSSYADINDPESSVGKHLRENDYIMSEKHRDWGDVTIVGQPVKFMGTPNTPRAKGTWHAPDLGEHNKEVLVELGYSATDVAKMTDGDGPAPPAQGAWAPKQR